MVLCYAALANEEYILMSWEYPEFLHFSSQPPAPAQVCEIKILTVSSTSPACDRSMCGRWAIETSVLSSHLRLAHRPGVTTLAHFAQDPPDTETETPMLPFCTPAVFFPQP